MKEIVEFRIFKKYYHLLQESHEAIDNRGAYVIQVAKDSPLYEEIGILQNFVRDRYHEHFYGYYKIQRKYTKVELNSATLFQFKIKSAFESVGEECGTVYDETSACDICFANRIQIGPLKLKSGSIPKKDIARTIAGEVVVSEHLVSLCKDLNLNAGNFGPVLFSNKVSHSFQLIPKIQLAISEKTLVGKSPFDLSTEPTDAYAFKVSGDCVVRFEKEVYKCPKGHLIGPSILSEAYVHKSSLISENDVFVSKEKLGTKQGLLRPEPLYFCSPRLREMVLSENLKGFEFEVAHVV